MCVIEIVRPFDLSKMSESYHVTCVLECRFMRKDPITMIPMATKDPTVIVISKSLDIGPGLI